MKINKQKVKVYIAIIFFFISITAIYSKQNLYSKLALVSKDKSQIQYLKGCEVTEKVNNDGEDVNSEQRLQATEDSILGIEEKIDLKLEDKASPNNIDNINTKVLEDNMIINFQKPEDNGTNYEYVITNGEKEKKLKFYKKTDIKGYGYIVDNNEENQANEYINKFDNGSILLENLNWSKDYYLHIRTFDENNNSSESKTFKLYLPSDGVSVKYIDLNNNIEIQKAEKIGGNANDKYDASDLYKNVDGYQLIETEGEMQGKLQKDKINIKYKYAKNATAKIQYINQQTQEQVADSKIIEGYEGKEINIDTKEIYGYKCESSNIEVKMNPGENIINIYYNEIPKGNVIIKYVDKENNNEIAENDIITNYIGETYYTKAKDIENYKLEQEEQKTEGKITDETKEIIYYYIKKKEEDANKMSEDNNVGTIIDEIVNSLDTENSLVENTTQKSQNKNENEKVTSEYQIIMDCSDSDYIIYYKVN